MKTSINEIVEDLKNKKKVFDEKSSNQNLSDSDRAKCKYISVGLERIIAVLNSHSVSDHDNIDSSLVDKFNISGIESITTELVDSLNYSIDAAYYLPKREEKCKEKLNDRKIKKLIDGETISMISAIAIAIITVLISCFALCKWGYSGLAEYADSVGFIIGFASAGITLVVSIICKVINAIIKKHYNKKIKGTTNNSYSNDELLVAKYGDNPFMRGLFNIKVNIIKQGDHGYVSINNY